MHNQHINYINCSIHIYKKLELLMKYIQLNLNQYQYMLYKLHSNKKYPDKHEVLTVRVVEEQDKALVSVQASHF